MPTVSISADISFQADRDISILDAATKSNISLPYSCKTGRCSTCKCKVLSGETVALQPETGLSAVDKTEGWILSCVRSVCSDVLLEIGDFECVTLPPIKTLPCRISSLEKLAPNVIKVLLRLPPTANFNYVPGQYIDVIGPCGIRRSYSLASSDSEGHSIELHIRAVEGGAMSDYWFKQAKINDLLRLNGPLGTFFLRDTGGIDLIFLATGTGIAPVKAMLETIPGLSPERRPKSVTVLWGGRTNSDLYFDIGAMSGRHHYVPVLSRAGGEWKGARGYVQDVLLGLKPDLTNAAVYACGSDVMIHSAKEALVNTGLPSKRFYSDAFVCSATNLPN